MKAGGNQTKFPNTCLKSWLWCQGSQYSILLAITLCANGCTTTAPSADRVRGHGTDQVQVDTGDGAPWPFTWRLWRNVSHHAAKDPHLQLKQAPGTQDVLVEYDEQVGQSESIERRAYWLFRYVANASERPKPEFVHPEPCRGLTLIPLLPATMAGFAPVTNGYWAVLTTDPHRFDLWCDTTNCGSFDLPHYRGAPRASLWRVALTPVCAVTDTAILAVILGVASLGHAPG